MELPFLKQKRWPRMLGKIGEIRYGYSDSEELSEKACDELIAAYESKDGAALGRALAALIHCIQMKETEHADAHEPA